MTTPRNTSLNVNALLTVQILSRKGVLWEGKALSVSSTNSQGPFDLLPEHAHFVSLIEKNPIVVTTPTGDQTFTFGSSVIRMIDDVVTIFIDISENLPTRASEIRRY